MAVFDSKSAAQAAIRDHVHFFSGVHARVLSEKCVGMDTGFGVRLVQAGRGDGVMTATAVVGTAADVAAFVAKHSRQARA